MKPIESKYTLPAIGITGLFHLTGAVLLMLSKGSIYDFTLILIPINLLITAAIAFRFQAGYTTGFLTFVCIGFLLGLIIELVGVQTGWPFGSYVYGSALGFKIWDTPVLIGLNWILITYCVGCLLHPLKTHLAVKILTGSILLIILDYFMEPVAMKNDFWSWHNGTIPNQNYLGWAGVSCLMLGLFHLLPFNKNNKVAAGIFLLQFSFFIIQNLF